MSKYFLHGYGFEQAFLSLYNVYFQASKYLELYWKFESFEHMIMEIIDQIKFDHNKACSSAFNIIVKIWRDVV